MTALEAARERLEAYVLDELPFVSGVRAVFGPPEVVKRTLRRLEDELVSAARFSARPENAPF